MKVMIRNKKQTHLNLTMKHVFTELTKMAVNHEKTVQVRTKSNHKKGPWLHAPRRARPSRLAAKWQRVFEGGGGGGTESETRPRELP